MPVARPDLLVLDVNETLSDLAPMRGAFEAVGLPAAEAEAWFAGVLRDGFALTSVGANPSFADLAAESLRIRAELHGLTEVDGAVEEVMAAFTSLPVHPDVVPGLRGLAESGVRVVTLSNGSASVAEGLLERAGVADAVERMLSVADAPRWKPHESAYGHALSTCGVAADQAMLVAVHPWDVHGASLAGLRTAWVNRSRTTYPSFFAGPELEVHQLGDLASRWS